jgi:hypothetical protein
MRSARFTAFAGLVAAAAAFRASADETNYWPFYVMREDPAAHTQSWSSLGPLFFSGPGPGPEATHSEGFRPVYVRFVEWDKVTTDVLYPLFFYRQYSDSYKWSVFQLINHEGMNADAAKEGGPKDQHFDVWPFYFSRVTDQPSDSYHAVFPLYGSVKGFLGYERLTWILFPVFVESVKKGTHTTYLPWPILRVMGGASKGFAAWPLVYMTQGPGPARTNYFLWPFVWDNTLEPPVDSPPGTTPGTEFGVLPLFTRETAPGYVSENFAWPFFGFTERTIPYRYSERRYFWPFFVQGKGDTPGQERLVDRWGPFYSYSYNQGTDSTWIGWPFWHRKTWVDGDIHQAKTQFFYFLYWSQDQTSVSRPSLAPAYKRHFWPFVSIWDNGAGRRQLEAPSLTEVFFPDNPDMRSSWSPLFTLFRYDRQPTGDTRSSLLWDAVTWRRTAKDGLVEFHLGPVVGMRRRPEGARWSILGFDFGPKLNKDRAASR